MFTKIITSKITLTVSAVLISSGAILGWAFDGGVELAHSAAVNTVGEQEQVKSFLDAIQNPPSLSNSKDG